MQIWESILMKLYCYISKDTNKNIKTQKPLVS